MLVSQLYFDAAAPKPDKMIVGVNEARNILLKTQYPNSKGHVCDHLFMLLYVRGIYFKTTIKPSASRMSLPPMLEGYEAYFSVTSNVQACPPESVATQVLVACQLLAIVRTAIVISNPAILSIAMPGPL